MTKDPKANSGELKYSEIPDVPDDWGDAICQLCGEGFPCKNPEDRVYCSRSCARTAFTMNAEARRQ